MSTAIPNSQAAASPLYDPIPRPCHPRELGQREFEKLDIYGYRSVKEGRQQTHIGLHALAVALSLEFDPQVTAYVERPRKLQVGERQIELDFWVRYRNGREQCLKLVPNSETVAGPGKRVARERERLHSAATAASIALRLITEEETLRDGAQHGNRLLLLPLLQVSQSVAQALLIRERILTLLDIAPRLQIAQVERELAPHLPADVHAVLAQLVYQGLVSGQHDTRWSRHTLIWRVRE